MKQKVKTLMLSLMLTAATLTASAQQHYERATLRADQRLENRGFKALLNGKLPIEVMFQTTQNADDEWVTAGKKGLKTEICQNSNLFLIVFTPAFCLVQR